MSTLNETNVRMRFPQRLQKASQLWKEYMKPILTKRNQILKFWSAGYFAGGKNLPARPLNLTDRGISVLAPFLVMNSPQVYIKTRYQELRPYAYTTELALNYINKASNIHRVALRPATINSLIGSGIVKTGVMHKYDVEIQSMTHQLGEVYTEIVDDADYIGDVTARNRLGFELEGNTYSLPTEYAKEFFGGKHADNIRATYQKFGDPRPENVTKQDVFEETLRLKDYTEFADYYIPDENVIVTIDPHSPDPKILRTTEWDGIGRGPYDVLAYKYIPGTPVPVPPVWGWLDIEDVVNGIVNKMKKQANEEKTVLGYQSNAVDDANRIRTANDRSAVRIDNIDGVKTFDFPGINKDLYPWVGMMMDEWSAQGGNLDTAGGRQTQADTLGQEQMLAANSGRSIDMMLDEVYSFTQAVLEKRASLMWKDPVVQIPVEKIIDSKVKIPALFSKTDQKGEFWKYSFEMVPYSMQRLGPDVEYRRLMNYLSQVALPLAQAAASQGQVLDVPSVNKLLGRYIGIDEIDTFWKSVPPVNSMSMNPFNPQSSKKSMKPRGDDPRDGSQSTASREMNLMQQQNRTAGADQVA